jgi:hypothetical protein
MTPHAHAPQPSPEWGGFIDAASFGFSPEATGLENAKALQRAVDLGGTITVGRPGTYRLAATVYLGGQTELRFGHGVFVKKVDEAGPFCHVFLNKGALTKTWDEHILIEGFSLIVGGIDIRKFEVFGLHGQLAFFYVKDLRIRRFRCMDLGKAQYGIHICTFEDAVVEDVIIKGDKDGVHLGRGKRFTIRDGVFETFDDAIALNAHDYDVGNPELGWIENGVVENCHDLNAEKTTGYFCRILAGAWIDWTEGMEVQKSDTVVSNGNLYRVRADADGAVYRSLTRPTHETGSQVLDGIHWVHVQKDGVHTAGVRNVIFRDIFLEKPRVAFSVHFDNDKYSRSYYPGAPVPRQEQLSFENIRILHGSRADFLSIGTPMDVITISHSSFRDNPIRFHGNRAMADYQKTRVNMFGCVFNHPGDMVLVENSVDGKSIDLKTSANVAMDERFRAVAIPGSGTLSVESDLPGLKTAGAPQPKPTL